MRDVVLEGEVNRYLSQYGKTLDDRPIFRVVWAPEEVEWRTGEFAIEYHGKVIGTKMDTQLVPKYPYMQPCYVLEELLLGVSNPELPTSGNGTYEPIYTFESAAGVPLQLNMRVIEIIMHAKMNPLSNAETRVAIADKQEYKEKALRSRDMDAADTTTLLTHLHHGESNFTKGIRNARRN